MLNPKESEKQNMNLYPHQQNALDIVQDFNRCAFYHDMGLGKTYTGSEKLHQLGGRVNIVICQKSKVGDWVKHFFDNYPAALVYDGTKKPCLDLFLSLPRPDVMNICIINYNLIFRRPELLKTNVDTLMLDESSLIQNETSKRSKAVLKIKAKNIILLSGTPTGGKYEMLWSQAQLLGWNISKDLFYKHYVEFEWVENDGFKRRNIIGYKNTERMIKKFISHGAHFLKTDEVINLPEQTFIPVALSRPKGYAHFMKHSIIEIDDHELIGDTTLTKMLYARQLCGQYNPAKLEAFRDLVESTSERLIVFYNFTAEMEAMRKSLERPTSIVNGSEKDLEAYENNNDSITFIQYQAGAMGLNLQKANKIVYFTPPLSSELYEQSKKRIHRIGQKQPCFYYNLICLGTVEERIYSTLAMRKDYTDKLFESEK